MRPALRFGSVALLFVSMGAAGCLRGPIRDISEDDLMDVGSTGAADDMDSSTTDEPVPQCHSSYDPCLPVADDLDCADVVALGLAPVTVLGPDEYGLDRDNDGIGCEQ